MYGCKEEKEEKRTEDNKVYKKKEGGWEEGSLEVGKQKQKVG